MKECVGVTIQASKVTNVYFVYKDSEYHYSKVQDPNKASHIILEFGDNMVILDKKEGNNAYLLADALSD